MVPSATTAIPSAIIYPDSDGLPLAENTKQLRWIVVLFSGLCAMFREAADVFIGADLLWYPVEGQPEIRMAPDVLAAFGRPKGDRGSYMQWEEGDVPLTVVFEVLSPGNTYQEMIDKLLFYEEHGVEEYYVYDPDANRLQVYLRRNEQLLLHRFGKEFVSPRLGIRFDMTGAEMAVYRPNGQRFLTPEEEDAARVQTEQEADKAKQEADKAKQEAVKARQEAKKAEERSRRLAQLGRAARVGQASPEELAELEQFERDLAS
jgi:Uma2 family endonuclease